MTETPVAPSTARMIDYWLGGRHHFPVDVAAATAFEGAYGPCAAIFRSLRDFSGRAVAYLAAHGIDNFLVFGAGVPTLGNVHEVATDAHVLYTDIDPVTIALGQQILAGNDRAGYAYGDATDLASIDPAALAKFLPGWGGRRSGWSSSAWPRSSTTRPWPVRLTSCTELCRRQHAGLRLRRPGAGRPSGGAGDDGRGFPHARPGCLPGPARRLAVDCEGIVPVARWRPDGAPAEVPDAFYGGVALR